MPAKRGREGFSPASTENPSRPLSAHEQRARRGGRKRAQRPPDRCHRNRHNCERAGDERDRIHVQRERRRPDGIDPPRAQAEHDERAVRNRAGDTKSAADAGEKKRLAHEQPPNRRRIQPERLKQSDFLQPLLDAQLEEQPRQQQRRDDKEGTEIGEVLAEIGRAARRREPLRAHVVDGKSHRQRVELADAALSRIARGRRPAASPPAEPGAARSARHAASSTTVGRARLE